MAAWSQVFKRQVTWRAAKAHTQGPLEVTGLRLYVDAGRPSPASQPFRSVTPAPSPVPILCVSGRQGLVLLEGPSGLNLSFQFVLGCDP